MLPTSRTAPSTSIQITVTDLLSSVTASTPNVFKSTWLAVESRSVAHRVLQRAWILGGRYRANQPDDNSIPIRCARDFLPHLSTNSAGGVDVGVGLDTNSRACWCVGSVAFGSGPWLDQSLLCIPRIIFALPVVVRGGPRCANVRIHPQSLGGESGNRCAGYRRGVGDVPS